jgi:hypothetical protein
VLYSLYKIQLDFHPGIYYLYVSIWCEHIFMCGLPILNYHALYTGPRNSSFIYHKFTLHFLFNFLIKNISVFTYYLIIRTWQAFFLLFIIQFSILKFIIYNFFFSPLNFYTLLYSFTLHYKNTRILLIF